MRVYKTKELSKSRCLVGFVAGVASLGCGSRRLGFEYKFPEPC